MTSQQWDIPRNFAKSNFWIRFHPATTTYRVLLNKSQHYFIRYLKMKNELTSLKSANFFAHLYRNIVLRIDFMHINVYSILVLVKIVSLQHTPPSYMCMVFLWSPPKSWNYEIELLSDPVYPSLVIINIKISIFPNSPLFLRLRVKKFKFLADIQYMCTIYLLGEEI